MTHLVITYLVISLFLTVYVIVEEEADVFTLRPDLGRWIVILLLVPVMTLTVAVVAILEGLEGDGRDFLNVWKQYREDLVEAWHGR